MIKVIVRVKDAEEITSAARAAVFFLRNCEGKADAIISTEGRPGFFVRRNRGSVTVREIRNGAVT